MKKTVSKVITIGDYIKRETVNKVRKFNCKWVEICPETDQGRTIVLHLIEPLPDITGSTRTTTSDEVILSDTKELRIHSSEPFFDKIMLRELKTKVTVVVKGEVYFDVSKLKGLLNPDSNDFQVTKPAQAWLTAKPFIMRGYRQDLRRRMLAKAVEEMYGKKD